MKMLLIILALSTQAHATETKRCEEIRASIIDEAMDSADTPERVYNDEEYYCKHFRKDSLNCKAFKKAGCKW